MMILPLCCVAAKSGKMAERDNCSPQQLPRSPMKRKLPYDSPVECDGIDACKKQRVGVNVTSNVRNNRLRMSTPIDPDITDPYATRSSCTSYDTKRTMTEDIYCQKEQTDKNERLNFFSNTAMLEETKPVSEHECLFDQRTSKIESRSTLHPKPETMGKHHK
nr:hypothetical protein [Tanacetum cinerariifolium]